ncbi:threonylcarbamoyladenosine tRNA methylthiotransferase [Halyomorpha halys]|uniref:threonylcarbamoyladenosine tRNA methylthiotransferase n=1 Tax=Halyomorpha halys TaxID=286706 RepID=UPI0006D4E11A|nr:threonylcarbamoyladenosine tRNA methylthiotransferase [Halyomorpha halys]
MPGACSEIIDDIEDLIESQELDPRKSSRKGVTVRVKRHKSLKKEIIENIPDSSDQDVPRSIVPGTQKIFIKTWGCTHNNSDGEYMAGLLSTYGYTLTDDKLEADLWLLNSCTVKSPAEDHFRNEIEAAKKLGKYVVVSGCVPQGAPKSKFLKGLSIIGVQQIDRVVEVVEQTLNGNSVRLFGTKKSGGKKLGGAPLALPKVRRNPLIEIIPINTGCLNQCTYCKTKHARGELGSYPPEEIIARAIEAFSEGVVELWLTSEDTGAYGRDIGSSLPALLKELVKVIPEGAMLRVGMTNPPYILDHLEEMAEILSHDRVYSFLHVPVQSGSDSVLGEMKREYTRSDFEKVVDYLSSNVVGGVTIATDIICGFPTETEEDFEETMSLVAKYKFPSIFINQFFPRPGTPAAAMPRIHPKLVKERTKRLTEFHLSYEPYVGTVGTIHSVLVTEKAYDGVHFVAHNKRYQQILVPGKPELIGKVVKVEITDALKYCMIGRLIDNDYKTIQSNGLLKNSDEPNDSKNSILMSPSVWIVAFVIIVRVLWFFL